jgi:hypothetical protein
MIMKTALLFLAGFLFVRWASAADLSGAVQDEKGQPISGATVKIYTAGMRTGSSPVCPSCWADCTKSAKTDPNGAFQIKDVSDRLVFRLLILAAGFEPTFFGADPQKGPAQPRLKSRDLSTFHDKQILQGQVLGSDLKPVAGVTVEPDFNQQGLDPVAITDEPGEFALTCPNEIRNNALVFRAQGYAPLKLRDIAGGSPPLKVVLTRGVTVTGRVLNHGRPIAGIGVGIVQTEEGRSEKWLGPQTTVTDKSGAFCFPSAIPRSALALYGLMDSLSKKGAIPVRIINTGNDDTTFDAGDLAIGPAGEIKARLCETDGKLLPPQTRIQISCDVAWDWQLVDVSPDGSFRATGLPLGQRLNITAPRDHEIQKVNDGFTIDPLNNRVIGTLSQSLSDLQIDLVYKDEKTQQADRASASLEEPYAAFFAEQKFKADQTKLFIADKLEERHIFMEASQNGSSYSAAEQKGDEVLQKLLVAGFGAKVCQDYVRFENIREGLIVISWFYNPPQDQWLTQNEKEKLALALWPVQQDVVRQIDPSKHLSQEQKTAQTNDYINHLRAEGEKVLPTAKHPAFEKALAGFKQMLLRMVSQRN